ncbi:MAG: ribosome biogenesis GTPase Der [Candidatus Riflebacteria bacterium]|nr:ribosome biogenesis GTPase Der [Candidatus Riflebacteria bacterium]
MSIPTVAIIGRPNVGKSSLLNRIVGYRHAIVDPTPGVTRDRNYADSVWNGRRFHFVDTGGLDPDNTSSIQDAIDDQVDFALNESDAIIFLLDSRDGLHQDDGTILNLLRKRSHGKPILVAVNKVDDAMREDVVYEFYSLGVEKIYAISAIHGHGVADLLDALVKPFPRNDGIEDTSVPEEPGRIAIVGKPNVGKSSLFNHLLGQSRSIVDNVPGTTRDSINVTIERNGKKYRFVDTAGLRRPARRKDSVELFSVFRTLDTISRSDIAVLMLDATTPEISEQDKRIASHILEAGSACVIVWNKWDVPEKTPRLWDAYLKVTRDEFSLMDFASVLSCSAKTGRRVDEVFALIDQVRESGAHRIPPERLRDILYETITIQPPPSFRGKALRLSGLRQLNGPGIAFKVSCSEPRELHFSYQRFLMNQLRQEYPFHGWPVRLFVGGMGKTP